MRARDLRMLPVVVSCAAIALISVLLPNISGFIAVACWTASLAAVGVALRARRSHGAALIAVACVAGAVAASHVALAEPGRVAAAEYLGDRVTDHVVRVDSKVEPGGGMLWFTGDIDTPGGVVPVRVTWRTDSAASDGLDLGAVVRVTGRVDATGRGDGAVVALRATHIEVAEPPPHLFAASTSLRRGFVNDVVAGLPDPAAGLLPGLSVGETSGVSEDMHEAMIISSLSHLTAVSGSNCALVVGIAFAICAAVGARRWVRVVVALGALVFFVVIVTPEESVLRAATMAAVAMLALLLGRAGAGVAVLSVAITVLICSDPWLAASYPFLLSSVATAALLLLAEPLASGLRRWMPRALALGIAVPLAAQLACQPIVLLFAPEVPLLSVPANMIAAPAAPIATVLGFLACITQPIPVFSYGVAAIAWLPSAWIAHTALTFSSLPMASVDGSVGWWGFSALVLIGALTTIAIIPLRRGRLSRLVRAVSSGALALIIGVMAGKVALESVVAPLTTPRDWAIALCDVGQGDAIVVRSAGRVALIDTGPEPEALSTCFAKLGVDHVDIAFLTHFDHDHVGAVEVIAGRVDTVVYGPTDDDADVPSLDVLGAGEVREGEAGMAGTLGDAVWRIVWPRNGGTGFDAGNATSLVIDIGGGEVPRTLLLGDLGEAPQRVLAGAGAVAGPYDVVKVAHHGSRDQLDALYETISAPISLIGVGENSYGHPHPDVLEMLARTGTLIGRSDEDGLVLVAIIDDGLSLWREHG
ncbi:ComEC/Rec2 family competence protein [Microbacterium amylolyticum]|uniref:Competence protein ComEC n=1 Tax=Microbacterium amylolyticum TaxID=936337 RepID=A0ABS4ZF98_9MICO|nr:ComEC/Rec2 family competence protein [Microbacterium amylolyticum]MBP2435660.1 competence protein ComEC [Microbacterium amylolyticum]